MKEHELVAILAAILSIEDMNALTYSNPKHLVERAREILAAAKMDEKKRTKK